MMVNMISLQEIPKWLTPDYARDNGWYPVPDIMLDSGERYDSAPPADIIVIGSPRDGLPSDGFQMKSRKEFRSGDIVIFDYANWLNSQDNYTPDMQVVTGEDIREYKLGKRSLLPEGIVVHPPACAVIQQPLLEKALK